MRKTFFHLTFILIAFKLHAQSSIDEEFKYPKQINTPQLKSLFDSTKWCMYCMVCDVDVDFTKKSNIKEKLTYGQLALLLDTLSIRGDTIEINCKFFYKKVPVDKYVTELLPLWGKVFVKGEKKFVMYSSRNDARYYFKKGYDPKNSHDRSIKPLQPAVKKYIKENKDKIDPWFLEAAKKRHVFK